MLHIEYMCCAWAVNVLVLGYWCSSSWCWYIFGVQDNWTSNINVKKEERRITTTPDTAFGSSIDMALTEWRSTIRTTFLGAHIFTINETPDNYYRISHTFLLLSLSHSLSPNLPIWSDGTNALKRTDGTIWSRDREKFQQGHHEKHLNLLCYVLSASQMMKCTFGTWSKYIDICC